MIYSGVDMTKRAQCGVAILIHNRWRNKIESYTYINERLVITRLKISRGHLTIIGAYAPEEGKTEETELFYEELQKQINNISKGDYLIISGDLNARIGKIPIPEVVGAFGEDTLNRNGHELRHFAAYNELRITNSFFRKRDIHKYTWSARGYRSIIDYVIVNKKLSSLVQDVRVHRGSDIHSDHYLVVAKVVLLAKWKKIRKIENPEGDVYKVYLLQEDSIKYLYQQRLLQYLQSQETKDDINQEWNNIKNCIHQAATEAVGKKKKFRRRAGLRIWNDEIEQAIKEKQQAYLRTLQNNSEEIREIYVEKRNRARAIVRRAHQESWDRLISNIEHDIHGRQEVAYKLMRQLNKQERDTARLHTIDKEAWIQHYRELWTDGADNGKKDESDTDCLSRFSGGDCSNTLYTGDPITLTEVQEAVKQMKNRKATGLDNINIELIKYGGIMLHLRILHLVNECWKQRKIPEEWQTAEVISLYKKGNRSLCENYRGISLLNVAYKLYARVINNRLKKIADVLLLEEQNGFRKGRSCNDNITAIRQIIEKRREYNLETHIAFIDYVKAFDRVNRTVLWEIMEKHGYPRHLVEVIKGLYLNTNIIINTGLRKTSPITITRGVRQGCSLSPTLFNIYIDDMVRQWKHDISVGIRLAPSNTYINTLMFADDQVILQKSEDDLQHSVYRLYQICKVYNLEISEKKTKVMAFKGKFPVRSKIVINGNIIDQVSHFNFLGCDISYEYENDVDNKLHKYQRMCGTIHRQLGNKTTRETKMKFYKVMASPLLTYGSESWTMRKRDKQKIQSAEMKFLRRTKGCTLRDQIRNSDIRADLKIYSMTERIEENSRRWKQHIGRMNEDRLVNQVLRYRPCGKRDIGRPRRRWLE